MVLAVAWKRGEIRNKRRKISIGKGINPQWKLDFLLTGYARGRSISGSQEGFMAPSLKASPFNGCHQKGFRVFSAVNDGIR